MAKRAKRPVGRPRKKHGPAKTVTLGLRVSGDLKAKVEAAGDKFGRTQSREAEHRLRLSFRTDDLYGEMRLVLLLIATLEEVRGTKWSDDAETCAAALGLFEAFFMRFGPKGLKEKLPRNWTERGLAQEDYSALLDSMMEIMTMQDKAGAEK